MNDWKTKEFLDGCDVLIKHKPFDKCIMKALEELGELNVKLLQLLNKPEVIKSGDIEEEIMDCEMHLYLLNKLFYVSPEIRQQKITKMVNSKDFLFYKKISENC